jgi:hypothetical protein
MLLTKGMDIHTLQRSHDASTEEVGYGFGFLGGYRLAIPAQRSLDFDGPSRELEEPGDREDC